MLNGFEKINFVFEDPYLIMKKEKSKGKRIIGVTPMYFPQELVRAAGALPVILQASKEPVTLGFHHYYHFFCGLTRGIVDQALKGKLDFLDGFILSDMCFEMRHIADPLRRANPFPIIYIQWPLEADEKRWQNFIVKRLEKCAGQLEALLGTKITDRDMEDSIAIYNENRALLRRIYDLRKSKPAIMTAKEMSALVISSMVMPVEENNAVLSELIPELEKREIQDRAGVNLFLSGHLCHEVKEGILDLIETAGGIVVGDDIYAGFRYYSTDISLDAPPLDAFARYYLDSAVPCPTRVEYNKDWADYLIKSVKGHSAKGIIIILAKNCEPQMIYYPYLKSQLVSAEVPHILIEVEHEMVSTEGIRTRIQAFIEMLREKGEF